MCEFNIILDDKIQFRDVIYTKVEGDNVIVKNIIGESKEFKGYRIVEVDVPNTRLVVITSYSIHYTKLYDCSTRIAFTSKSYNK